MAYNSIPISVYFSEVDTLISYGVSVWATICIQARFMGTVTRAVELERKQSELEEEDPIMRQLKLWEFINTIVTLLIFLPRSFGYCRRFISPTQIRRHPVWTRIWGALVAMVMASQFAQVVWFFVWWSDQSPLTTPLWLQHHQLIGTVFWDLSLILLPAGVMGVCFLKAVKGTIFGWWEIGTGVYIYQSRQGAVRTYKVVTDSNGNTDIELGEGLA